MAAKKPKTNTQFLKDIVAASQYGTMKEVFILASLIKYSREVLNEKVNPYAGLISDELWQGMAQEMIAQFDAREYK